MQCLDVLRTLSKEPGALDALFDELGDGHGDRHLAAHIAALKGAFQDTSDIQYRARQLTEGIAVALQGKLLLEAGNAAVSDGFIAGRIASGGRVYGTLPRGVDVETLLLRSSPQVA
ncbi:putative acyl-CoA dehydrogenase [Pseudomonas savastanoi pv. phaseolicola]|nr:putative acyl-CoA dehydrogenase [Pseudomonas savastanoi pv. phaseolicola]